MVEVTVKKVDNFHFRATDAAGLTVDMDAPENGVGGQHGVRPMQMMLMALGGCSGIDVVSILKKKRQPYKNIVMKITGERMDGKAATPYKSIHIHFTLTGNLDAKKVEKAIQLSVEKYCSVAKTLDKTADITYTFEINHA